MGNSANGFVRVCSSGQTVETSVGNVERLVKSVLNDKDWTRINALWTENPLWASHQDDDTGMLPLHRVLLCGAPKETVEILLQQYPDSVSTAEFKKGRISVHIAAMGVSGVNETYDIIKVLLARYPNGAFTKDSEGKLPLHYALLYRAGYETVSALVDAFPKGVELLLKDGKSPLFLACEGRVSNEVVLYILQKHPAAAKLPSAGKLPLHILLEIGSFADCTIKALLKIDPEGAGRKTIDGMLCIHYALMRRADRAIVQLLVQAYPDGVDMKCKKGRLPLHYAIDRRCSNEVIFYLIEVSKSSASRKDYSGDLPLHVALERRSSYQVVRALLQAYPHGAAEKDRYETLPLRRAVKAKADVSIIDLLLRANPQAAAEMDDYGRQPLHYAVSGLLPLETISALLRNHPPCVSIADINGVLPIHLAVIRGASIELVELLISSYPAGLAARDRNGYLPLHFALIMDAPIAITLLLIERNPATVAEWLNSQTSLHIALATKRPESVIKKLLEAFPQAAREQEGGGGRLPLMVAMERGATLTILLMLEAAYAEDCAIVPDHQGRLSIHYALKYGVPQELFRRLLHAYPSVIGESNFSFYYDNDDAFRVPGNPPAEIMPRPMSPYRPDLGSEEYGTDSFLTVGSRNNTKKNSDRYSASRPLSSNSNQQQYHQQPTSRPTSPLRFEDRTVPTAASLDAAADYSTGYRGAGGGSGAGYHHDYDYESSSSSYQYHAHKLVLDNEIGDDYNHAADTPAYADDHNNTAAATTGTVMGNVSSVPPRGPPSFQSPQQQQQRRPQSSSSSSGMPNAVMTTPPLYRGNETKSVPSSSDRLGTPPLFRPRSSRPASGNASRVQQEQQQQPQQQYPAAANSRPLSPLINSSKRRSITFIDNNTIRRDPDYSCRPASSGVGRPSTATNTSTTSTTQGGIGMVMGTTSTSSSGGYPRRSSISRRSKEKASSVDKISPLQLGAMAMHFVSRNSPSIADKLTGRSHLSMDGRMTPGRPESPQTTTVGAAALMMSSRSSRPATAREAKEAAAMRMQFREKRLLEFAVEDMHASQEAVAEILKLSMPISIEDCSQNIHHYYNWCYILSETADRYVDAVELVLDCYGNHNSLAFRLLNDSPDRLGRRAIETATKKCQQALSRRLYFYGRYELASGSFAAHESPDCVVWLATDYDRSDSSTDVSANADTSSQKVALKFVRSKKAFYHTVRAWANVLTSDHCVIRIIRYHDGDEDPIFLRDTAAKGLGEFPYCIVLQAGERDLAVAILRDRFTVKQITREGVHTRDWVKIGRIGRDITAALAHIHSHGMAHGSLAPSNIILHKGVYKLNDFSASASFSHDDDLGRSRSCLAYMPPEMINIRRLKQSRHALADYLDAAAVSTTTVTVKRNEEEKEKVEDGVNTEELLNLSDQDELGVVVRSRRDLKEEKEDNLDLRLSALTVLKADPSVDMWSLGAVMLQLCRGDGLVRPLQGDILDDEQLKRLACWTDWETKNLLSCVDSPIARNFLCQLLQVIPRRRSDAVDLVNHPFVRTSNPTATTTANAATTAIATATATKKNANCSFPSPLSRPSPYSSSYRFPGIEPVYDVFVCYRSDPYTESSIATLPASMTGFPDADHGYHHRTVPPTGISSIAADSTEGIGDDGATIASPSMGSASASDLPPAGRIVPLTATALAEYNNYPVVSNGSDTVHQVLANEEHPPATPEGEEEEEAKVSPLLQQENYGVILTHCLVEQLGLRVASTPLELTKNVFHQKEEEEEDGNAHQRHALHGVEGAGGGVFTVIREGNEREEGRDEKEDEEDDDDSDKHNVNGNDSNSARIAAAAAGNGGSGNNQEIENVEEQGGQRFDLESHGLSQSSFNHLLEAAEKMIQSRCAVFVLSRGAVNEGVNSFEELVDDSLPDHVLLQMRLAVELRAFGLLEGGIISVVVGDKKRFVGSDSDKAAGKERHGLVPVSIPCCYGSDLDVSYGEYFESYDGRVLGHFGGCHPRCSSTVIVHSVEATVAELLRRHHLGKKVYDSLSVLETVSPVVAHSIAVVGPMKTAWLYAIKDLSKAIAAGANHLATANRGAAGVSGGAFKAQDSSDNRGHHTALGASISSHSIDDINSSSIVTSTNDKSPEKLRLLQEIEAKKAAMMEMQEQIEKLQGKLDT